MTIKRQLIPSASISPGKCVVGGKTYWDFSSNDSLCLSQDRSLLDTVSRETTQMGSTGSRLLSGDHELLHTLESEMASWLGAESVQLFNTGYQMNVGVVSTLWGPQDVIFMDRAVHASMVDGVRLSGARFHRFRHQDLAHLAQLLSRYREAGKRAVILTESVYSMDGDVTDLPALVALKDQYNAELYVDEAHAVGVFGPLGKGCCQDQGVTASVDYIAGTFGKAFGSFGAFLGCSELVKDQLINQCRSLIYSTGLPFPVVQWNLAALSRIQSMDKERAQVAALASQLRQSVADLGLEVLGESHIVPVVFGTTQSTEAASLRMKAAGVWVPAIRRPTVPEAQSRLRFSLTLGHVGLDFEPILTALV